MAVHCHIEISQICYDFVLAFSWSPAKGAKLSEPAISACPFDPSSWSTLSCKIDTFNAFFYTSRTWSSVLTLSNRECNESPNCKRAYLSTISYLAIVHSTKLTSLLDRLRHGFKTDAFFLSEDASCAGTSVSALLTVSELCFQSRHVF